MNFFLADSLLDLTSVSADLVAWVASGATAGLAIMAALYGVRVIRRAFLDVGGEYADSGVTPEFEAEYNALADLQPFIDTEEDWQAWKDLQDELFTEEGD